jgi:SAM-dependent methyltransferase
MTKTNSLEELYERDRIVWDDCAEQYEQSIVSGHPDIIAYEEFEEDFFDRMLINLMRDKGKDIHLYDVGCGSARLHLHYGLKSTNADLLDEEEASVLKRMRKKNVRHSYDPVFDLRLKRIGGLDFSEEMINIARKKLVLAGLESALQDRLYLEVGSAFEMEPMKGPEIPLAVSVCNSIGVMQGPQGAQQLFVSMRKAVEEQGGIAIISCYRRKAIPTYALGNYESTMNVSGQPKWLEPKKYADPAFAKIPRRFKRAHDQSDTIKVNVFAQDGKRLETDFTMKRNPDAVEEMMETGHIQMHSEYESRWYATSQISQWIEKYWNSDDSHHVLGEDVDRLRAEPMQFAIYDPSHLLDDLMQRWNIAG